MEECKILSLANCLKLLSSHSKLERDKGYCELEKVLNINENEKHTLEEFGKILLTEYGKSHNNERWESRFGRLQAGNLLLEKLAGDTEFVEKMKEIALSAINDAEFRVRIAAGEFLGSLCKHVSPSMYKSCEEVLIASIRENLERHSFQDDDSDSKNIPKDAKEIFHDTAGWKCLETSMKSLKSVIEGSGESFLEYLSQELLNLIFETLQHTNRFVRETGYYVCAALVRYGVTSDSKAEEHVQDFGRQLAEHLRDGLSDNWSQVRLAASVATRDFFKDLSKDDKEKYFPLLLPPMCLNRYYLAEGVRLYNQETWKMVVGQIGKELVEKHISAVVEFYLSQTLSDNHAVREAACHCMAELACKIDKEAVNPFVKKLLDGLLVCFNDDSWPVRDTACVACGQFALSHPDVCKESLEVLYPLFFTNLSDPIPSVRQGAAVALAKVTKAYGQDSLKVVFKKIKEGFKAVETQQENIGRYESLEKSPATYGVVKRLRDNDFELHSDQQMYSCGSLAPKMGRGGCSDHSFKRPSEPWEMTDGCICLVAELASNPSAMKMVVECLPALSKAVGFRHYAQYIQLLETFCSELPIIAKGIGKRSFKAYLEMFLDSLFEAHGSENNLTRTAATECFSQLSALLGPNILRGRIEQYSPVYLRKLDSTDVFLRAPSKSF